jgi:hypothetical protein
LKKLAFASGAAALGLGALLVAHTSHAADHVDAPMTTANPMADIGDVYAWMTTDGTKVNLVMTVSPADDGTRSFGPTIQYVFHTTALSAYGVTTGAVTTDIICTFATNTSAQCWVGNGLAPNGDYVSGDPSPVAGVQSGDARVKLFAGRRADAFFFDLNGFRDAVTAVENTTGLVENNAGCPALSLDQETALVGLLSETSSTTNSAPCPADAADCFAGLNVLAIVLQVDKTLLTSAANPVLAVWGSTNTAP